jgi:hypothetical protein
VSCYQLLAPNAARCTLSRCGLSLSPLRVRAGPVTQFVLSSQFCSLVSPVSVWPISTKNGIAFLQIRRPAFWPLQSEILQKSPAQKLLSQRPCCHLFNSFDRWPRISPQPKLANQNSANSANRGAFRRISDLVSVAQWYLGMVSFLNWATNDSSGTRICSKAGPFPEVC